MLYVFSLDAFYLLTTNLRLHVSTMFKRLQKKWKVSGWRLLLILITFAVGGSLTGLAGRKIMSAVENAWIYVPVYIIVVTLIWPLMVLLVSIPLGQFFFFRSYLKKMGSRMKLVKSPVGSSQLGVEAHSTFNIQHSTSAKQIAIFA